MDCNGISWRNFAESCCFGANFSGSCPKLSAKNGAFLNSFGSYKKENKPQKKAFRSIARLSAFIGRGLPRGKGVVLGKEVLTDFNVGTVTIAPIRRIGTI